MNTTTPKLGWGERAPDFVLPLKDGKLTRFYALAGGRPTVLLFHDADESDALLCFNAALNEKSAAPVSLFAVERDTSVSNPHEREIPFPVFSDREGVVHKAYRLGQEKQTTLFLLSPNLRVLASLSLEDTVATAQKVISILNAALPKVDPLEIVSHAPVLMIPNALEAEVCEYLVAVWEHEGNIETGVEQSHAEQRANTINHDSKRRRDHTVTDENLTRRLAKSIGGRVMPEVQKAFAFQATHFEGFKVACYDATVRGFFSAHRDNLSPKTAHRRFAMSLNLNDEYTGGHLRFPEYGAHLYRPEAGGALIFSSSHLHEVTAVTEGRRFVLLSFLY